MPYWGGEGRTRDSTWVQGQHPEEGSTRETPRNEARVSSPLSMAVEDLPVTSTAALSLGLRVLSQCGSYCDGSTWLGHEGPWLLVNHGSVCLGGFFWMRLTFEYMDWVKQVVGGPPPTHRRSKRNIRLIKKEFPCSDEESSSWDIGQDSDWNSTVSSGSPACWRQTGTSQPL